MILYQLNHLGGLGFVLTHRLTVMRDKQATLMVNDVYAHRFAAYVKYGLFTQVVSCATNIGYEVNDEDAIESEIVTYYDNFIVDNKIDLQSFEDIFTVVDVGNSFGIYLSIKGIRFCLCEMHQDQLNMSRKTYSEKAVSRSERPYTRVIYKHGSLLGTVHKNSLNSVMLYPQTSNTLPDKINVRLFSPHDSICMITDSDFSALLRIWNFSVSELPAHGMYLVVLSNSMNGRIRPILQRYGSKKPYTLMVQASFDLFLPEGITPFMKFHPQNTPAIESYPGAVTCNNQIDAIFFDHICKKHGYMFDGVISYGTTAMKSMSTLVAGGRTFALECFVKSFEYANRFYFICAIYKHLLELDTIYVIGKSNSDAVECFKLIAELFGLSVVNDYPTNKVEKVSAIVVLDSTDLDIIEYVRSNRKAVLFFPMLLDSHILDSFISHNMLDRLLIRKIQKAATGMSYYPKGDEAIYIYSGEGKLRYKLFKFSHERNMKWAQTKLSLKNEKLSDLASWRKNEYTAWLERRIANLEKKISILSAQCNKK